MLDRLCGLQLVIFADGNYEVWEDGYDRVLQVRNDCLLCASLQLLLRSTGACICAIGAIKSILATWQDDGQKPASIVSCRNHMCASTELPHHALLPFGQRYQSHRGVQVPEDGGKSLKWICRFSDTAQTLVNDEESSVCPPANMHVSEMLVAILDCIFCLCLAARRKCADALIQNSCRQV